MWVKHELKRVDFNFAVRNINFVIFKYDVIFYKGNFLTKKFNTSLKVYFQRFFKGKIQRIYQNSPVKTTRQFLMHIFSAFFYKINFLTIF